MNREIKFRAWNGEKILHNFVVGRPQAADCLSIMTDEKFAKRTYELKEWKIMQFTGLLDKNGKEIYEGDIVAMDIDGDGWYGGQVIYIKEEARFWIDYEEFEDWDYCEKQFEVLGNIYENPELRNDQ